MAKQVEDGRSTQNQHRFRLKQFFSRCGLSMSQTFHRLGLKSLCISCSLRYSDSTCFNSKRRHQEDEFRPSWVRYAKNETNETTFFLNTHNKHGLCHVLSDFSRCNMLPDVSFLSVPGLSCLFAHILLMVFIEEKQSTFRPLKTVFLEPANGIRPPSV